MAETEKKVAATEAAAEKKPAAKKATAAKKPAAKKAADGEAKPAAKKPAAKKTTAAKKPAKKAEAKAGTVTVKLAKSLSGRGAKQIATAKSLGLSKIGDVTVQPDNAQTAGKIAKISHLVVVTNA